MRKLSILALKYTFLGQNKLNRIQNRRGLYVYYFDFFFRSYGLIIGPTFINFRIFPRLYGYVYKNTLNILTIASFRIGVPFQPKRQREKKMIVDTYLGFRVEFNRSLEIIFKRPKILATFKSFTTFRP